MKLHALSFAIAAVAIIKMIIGQQSFHEGLLLFGIAFIAYIIGAISFSFSWDKANGSTATRDAIVILCIWTIVKNFSGIVGFIVALGLVLFYK